MSAKSYEILTNDISADNSYSNAPIPNLRWCSCIVFEVNQDLKKIRHSCASQVPTKHPYSVSNYIEELFFNAMELDIYSDGLLPYMMFDENSHSSLQWKLEIYSN